VMPIVRVMVMAAPFQIPDPRRARGAAGRSIHVSQRDVRVG
jgi:hypothetical protein